MRQSIGAGVVCAEWLVGGDIVAAVWSASPWSCCACCCMPCAPTVCAPPVQFDHVLFTVNDFHPSLRRREDSVPSREDSWQACLERAWTANAGNLHRYWYAAGCPRARCAIKSSAPCVYYKCVRARVCVCARVCRRGRRQALCRCARRVARAVAAGRCRAPRSCALRARDGGDGAPPPMQELLTVCSALCRGALGTLCAARAAQRQPRGPPPLGACRWRAARGSRRAQHLPLRAAPAAARSTCRAAPAGVERVRRLHRTEDCAPSNGPAA